ncbi:hypothetical protein VTG60DRAFT_6238 [Thermothelomyces hinnuleus]
MDECWQEDGDRHHELRGNHESVGDEGCGQAGSIQQVESEEEGASGRGGGRAGGDGIGVQDLEMADQNPNHGSSSGNAIGHHEDEQRRRVQRGEGAPQRSSLWTYVKQHGAPSGESRYVTWEARRVPRQGQNGERLPRASRGDPVGWGPLVSTGPASTPVSSSQPAGSFQVVVQGTQVPNEYPTAHRYPLVHGAPALSGDPAVGVNPVIDGDATVNQCPTVEEHPVLDENPALSRDGVVDEVENEIEDEASPAAGTGEALGAMTEEGPERGRQDDGDEHGIEGVIEGGPQGTSQAGLALPEDQGIQAADTAENGGGDEGGGTRPEEVNEGQESVEVEGDNGQDRDSEADVYSLGVDWHSCL